MTVELHIVDAPEFSADVNYFTFMDDPGAMFRWPEFDDDGREAWCISLPNEAGLWWTTYRAKKTGKMWEVTGIPPKITVKPSIDAGKNGTPHGWHGFITEGILVP